MSICKKDEKYIHFSIDDVCAMLREIIDGTYESIFDHPEFLLLRKLHDAYGAVFTLELFYETLDGSWNLSMMGERYKPEFQANSDWIRMGFHAYNYQSDYNTIDSVEASSHYNKIFNEIVRFASVRNWDTMPRTHFFSGVLESCRAWRDKKSGINGLLTSDDDRALVYYLNEEQRLIVRNMNCHYDPMERLYFIKTQPRLEKWLNPVGDLERWRKDQSHSERMNELAFFWHEGTAGIDKVEGICQWGIENGYTFAFPMDKIM
jgi:hypothetical protein